MRNTSLITAYLRAHTVPRPLLFVLGRRLGLVSTAHDALQLDTPCDVAPEYEATHSLLMHI